MTLTDTLAATRQPLTRNTLTERMTEQLDNCRSQHHADSTEARYPQGTVARCLDAAVVAGYLGHLGTVTKLWGANGFETYRFENTAWTHAVLADGTVATRSTGIDCSELEQYGRCRTPNTPGHLHLHNAEMDTDDTVYADRRRSTLVLRRDGKTYRVPAHRVLALLDARS